MAPKGSFKVHSLQQHIENTNKGLSAEAQFNRRTASRAPVVKKDPDSFDPNHIFSNIANNNDDDEEESSDSDSSSDGEGPPKFLEKLGVSSVKASAATPTRRRNNKDVEIADSDVERNATSKAVTAKPEPESSDDSSSESESESEDDTKTKTNGITAVKAPETSSTSSSSSESESESEDDEPAKLNATKPDESSSEESSEDESESEAEPQPKAKAHVNGNAAATTTSSSDESESDSEDEPAKPANKPAEPESESSSSEEEDSDEDMADESVHIDQRQLKKAAVPNFIAPDFVLRKGEDGANGKDVAQICNQANLEGKQFWYFTVPSNVPISVVQNLEIPMDNSQQGNAVFSHDGEDYGVSFESIAPKGNIQILIPSADGSQYQSSSRQISQVMQVKKITQLANFPSAAIGPAARRAPRPQPENLTGRYQAIGVNDVATQEDTEMSEAPELKTPAKKEKKRKDKDNVVQATPTTGKAQKSKKRGESVVEPSSSATLTVSTPNVPRKGKRKHAPSEEDAAAAAEQLIQESKSAANSKKQKTNRLGSPDLGSEAPSTSTKKQTHVAPPTFPQSSTPAPSTAKKSKKSKEPKVELPPLSSASKQTPIPLPAIPHSSQAWGESTQVASPSVTKEEKRARKRKEKESKKSKESSETTVSRKETPVPAPVFGSSS
ncbi:DNA-directed RNA polymerase I subunit RPA34.5-domain-containing protein [Thelonectria olida]|uniref:DNA-directed RNA polymerase I subunit RPA34.5-domain-containing protein n=1 Tax=Thelonectria olida TaxID=1576542 RepID=A0A9P8WII6_9HYPO|nr:DNA-directed RNA polymerase I subunit RPA34.5-domain-containing protein [Thelonectria olida]